MLRTLWSVKGGAGVTVVAAALARRCAAGGPTALVDLAGDQPAALGLAEPDGPGITEWLHTAERSVDALARLGTPVTGGCTLVHRGRLEVPRLADWAGVVAAVGSLASTVVVDAGQRRLSEPAAELASALGAAGTSVLVTRACYLALRRATAQGVGDADGVVVVLDDGRALSPRDVGEILGLPVLAAVDVDPAVARSVDAGFLLHRPARGLQRSVRSIA